MNLILKNFTKGFLFILLISSSSIISQEYTEIATKWHENTFKKLSLEHQKLLEKYILAKSKFRNKQDVIKFLGKIINEKIITLKLKHKVKTIVKLDGEEFEKLGQKYGRRFNPLLACQHCKKIWNKFYEIIQKNKRFDHDDSKISYKEESEAKKEETQDHKIDTLQSKPFSLFENDFSIKIN